MIHAGTDFRITIHMVSSVDGFIARKDNSFSWFVTADHYEKGVEYSEQRTKPAPKNFVMK